MQRAARGQEVNSETLEIRFADGERKTVLMRAAPLRDGAGNVRGVVGAAADVSERHRYEEHLKLLVNELNHRVKNTLAIVQSIAALTLKDGDAAGRADFEQRLLALSAVHNLLTDENWDGARLMALAQTSLKAHLGGLRERISVTGEDFRVRPKSAVAISMALHELGTNAVKYGALSNERGSVAVRWTADNGRFRLTWEESRRPRRKTTGPEGFRLAHDRARPRLRIAGQREDRLSPDRRGLLHRRAPRRYSRRAIPFLESRYGSGRSPRARRREAGGGTAVLKSHVAGKRAWPIGKARPAVPVSRRRRGRRL